MSNATASLRPTSAQPQRHTAKRKRNAKSQERIAKKHESIKVRVAEYRLPYRDLTRLIEEFYIACDSPTALGLLLCTRAGDYESVVRHEINPRHYIDRDAFQRDFAAISFLRKSEFVRTGIDKEAAALAVFHAAEEQCSIVNKRFRSRSDLKHSQFAPLMMSLVRKIAKTLGVTPQGDDLASFGISVDELLDKGGWGPGVTTRLKGCDTSASRKFSEERELSHDLHRYFWPEIKEAYPTWLGRIPDDDLVFRESSSVITVPKNAKTDRTIAVEPGLNLWFQKACGGLLRSKLRKAGFNLNSTKEPHHGAFVGSRFGGLSTVDFSSASDTISTEVVRELLPEPWFRLLDACRLKSYSLKGDTRPLEKFSSMGNGFTFELESLIFSHAALAVCDWLGLPTRAVTVHGDDIVIPSEGFSLYSDFCSYLGFKVNTSKSFSDSRFRESCGAYYFDGYTVKPLFLHEEPLALDQVYGVINRLNELSARIPQVRDVARFLARRIPEHLRYYGAPAFGDSVIHADFDMVPSGQLRKSKGLEGFYFSGLLRVSATAEHDTNGHLLASLCRIGTGDISFGNETSLRDVTRLVKHREFYVARRWCTDWYN